MAADFIQNRRNTIARCLLRALARRERSGRAPARLTEPGLATWVQMKGNLELQHLLALVAEDAAIRFPIPADLGRVLDVDSQSFSKILDNIVDGWLRELTPDVLDAPRPDAIADYAKLLELPTRFAGADLHKIQADKRVLELPGTGGQLVARALERSPEAYLHTNCTVLTASWAERTLAGLAAMEWDAPGVDFTRDDADLAWATEPDQRHRFDLVFGLLPEKGGRWDTATLQSRFPAATIVLV
ncbi:MAG: hypothetical protein V4850_01205 [Myxococcota bacterium]